MTGSSTPRWEYRVEDFGGVFRNEPKKEDFQALLNAWGEDGWELVSAAYSTGTTRLRIIAKRPLAATARRRRTMRDWDLMPG
jgi:hypothetical protein